MATPVRGKLVVVSGPSGVGKTTILARLFEVCPLPLVRSISATTRPPRPGEKDEVDYHFLSKETFSRTRQAGGFVECFEVFGQGVWYGTLWSEVTPSLDAGKWVVLNIDVKGALAVEDQYPEALTFFIRPKSLAQLELQLRGRGTETEESLTRRLQQAQQEMAVADRYRYQVVNETIEQTARDICGILTGLKPAPREVGNQERPTKPPPPQAAERIGEEPK